MLKKTGLWIKSVMSVLEKSLFNIGIAGDISGYSQFFIKQIPLVFEFVNKDVSYNYVYTVFVLINLSLSY